MEKEAEGRREEEGGRRRRRKEEKKGGGKGGKEEELISFLPCRQVNYGKNSYLAAMLF